MRHRANERASCAEVIGAQNVGVEGPVTLAGGLHVQVPRDPERRALRSRPTPDERSIPAKRLAAAGECVAHVIDSLRISAASAFNSAPVRDWVPWSTVPWRRGYSRDAAEWTFSTRIPRGHW